MVDGQTFRLLSEVEYSNVILPLNWTCCTGRLPSLHRKGGTLMLTLEGLIAVISLVLTAFSLGYAIGRNNTPIFLNNSTRLRTSYGADLLYSVIKTKIQISSSKMFRCFSTASKKPLNSSGIHFSRILCCTPDGPTTEGTDNETPLHPCSPLRTEETLTIVGL